MSSSKMPNFQYLRFVYSYIYPQRFYFYLGLFCLLFSGITTMVFPYFAGKLIDIATGKKINNFENINQITLFLILVLAVQAVFSFFRVLLFSNVTANSMARIRAGLFQKIVNLPIHFYEKNRVGELTGRITGDIALLQEMLSTSLAEFLRQFITLIVGVIVLFFTSTKLTLFMLATFPVLVIAAIFFGKKIKAFSKETQSQLANANIITEEVFQSAQVVKSYVREEYEGIRYAKAIQKVAQYVLNTAQWRAGFISFIIFGLFGGIVIVLWYGAKLVSTNELSIGDLTSFIMYTGFIGASVAGMGELFTQIQNVTGATERIREILGMEDETIDKGIDKIDVIGDIEFKEVDFAYPTRTDIQVLNHLNLKIKAGTSLALVGASGAGKSTIVQLLLRLYDNFTGDIFIDNQNIKNIPLYSYRNLYALVPQDTILFGGTILENISYGNPSASYEEVLSAANQAYAHEFIMTFPEGYNTIVGERGLKLSGGQRQRIAIARAILKNPTILILDEATSALDNESEQMVQMALEQLMKNRTSIVIAHRLSTIQNANKIAVLKAGKIVQEGTHNELLANENGEYFNLLKSTKE